MKSKQDRDWSQKNDAWSVVVKHFNSEEYATKFKFVKDRVQLFWPGTKCSAVLSEIEDTFEVFVSK